MQAWVLLLFSFMSSLAIVQPVLCHFRKSESELCQGCVVAMEGTWVRVTMCFGAVTGFSPWVLSLLCFFVFVATEATGGGEPNSADQAAPNAKIAGWVPRTISPNAEARGAGSGSKEAEMR